MKEVYRTVSMIGVAGAALAAVCGGMPGLTGFACGAAAAVVSLGSLHVMVRGLVRPGLGMLYAIFPMLQFLKLLLLTIALTGVMWLVANGSAQIYAVVAGIGLVPASIAIVALRAGLDSQRPPQAATSRTAERAVTLRPSTAAR